MPSAQQRLAAVQGDALAVHVGGVVAAQGHDEAADVLLAVPHPALGNGGDEGRGFLRVVIDPPGQPRGEGVGQDRVGADAVRPPLAGGGAGE